MSDQQRTGERSLQRFIASNTSTSRREALLGLAGGTLLARDCFSQGQTDAERPPNIVIILCDDLGYGDLASYGSSIPTPNLSRMAAEGMKFTNFCSADPVCSPSRAALLTGRYPTRVGVPRVLFPQDPAGLNRDEKTLADVLKVRGYRTACIGKWHLGRPVEYLPTNRGFDSYLGIPYSNDMTPSVLLRDTKVVESPVELTTLTRRYTEAATDFIGKAGTRPFFLYMPHTFPHIPLAVSDRFRGKSKQGIYGDVLTELDWSVGAVLSAIREAGADSNTLVLFTSDNGPWYQGSPGKLRGRKDSTFEGGVREPFIARWPGKIPAGTSCDALTSMLDLFPTVSKLCGATQPEKPLDGLDVLPVLRGQQQSIERGPLLYFNAWNLQCARWNNWKLHIARYNTAPYVPAPPGGVRNFVLPKPELYNLQDDPDESYDVAALHPEIVQTIRQQVENMLQSFPQEVQQAYAEARSRQVDPATPAGAWPKAAAAVAK